MNINKLLEVVTNNSLPESKMVVDIPVETFKMSVDMLDARTYRWLESSEIVESITCGNILEGVAHEVEVLFNTMDSNLELVDVR